MTAPPTGTLHAIRSRAKDHPARRAKLDDFTLDEGTPVPADDVLNTPGWTLYCLHLPTRQAVFVQTPPQADLTAAPFLRMAQFEQASRVLTMPWDALHALALRVALPKNLIFIFGIGRSGTTLVSQMLGHVDGVLSLSEPNAQFDATAHRQANGPELTARLIAACTRLLCRQPDGSVPETLAFKFYSQSLFSCMDYFAAFPQAKYVFLYREAVSWANSLYKMSRGYGSPEQLDRGARDFMWSVVSAGQDIALLEKTLPPGAGPCHHEDIAAASRALHFETYMACLHAGVPFLALRYDEMTSDPAAATRALLSHCGLAQDAAANALRGLSKDSQEGSGIGQDNRIAGFTPDHVARFHSALARQARFKSPDLFLPDIHHPQRDVHSLGGTHRSQ